MKEHFSLRLAAILLFVTVLVMSVFVAIRYYYNYADLRANIQKNASVISSRIAEQVSPSIWEIYQSSVSRKFSEDAAVAVLNSEMKHSDVDAIVVHGRFGHIYMGRIKEQIVSTQENEIVAYHDRHEAQLDEHPFQFDHAIKNGSMTIGKVSVYFNDKDLRDQLDSSLRFDLIQTVVISLFIVFALYVTIRLVLIRPLESLEVANSTFNSIGEGIVQIDSMNRVLNANPAFFGMTGFDLTKTINQPCDFFTLDCSSERLLKTIESEINLKNNWSGEATCRRKDGSSFPIQLTASQVFNDERQKICRVLVFQDISQQKKAEEQLMNFAFYDPLTGLYNRRKFEDIMRAEIKASKRTGYLMGLLFIDLDDFKYINDTLGHAVGDQLLVEISKRFQSRIRDNDHLSRLGGDEFTVITTHIASPEQTVKLAEDLINLASQPILLQDKEYKLGASIGVSIYPRDGDTIEELIKHADNAMYQAKESGKGNYNFYSSELDQKIQHKQTIKSLLRDALDNHEFFLHFQPKISLSGEHKAIGAEALIRWRSEELGLVSPEEFIPIAEESNIILDIGAWVVKEAFDVARSINSQRRGSIPFTIAINLSPMQLHSQQLIAYINSQLSKQKVETDWIEFEMTETSVIADLDLSINILNKLREMGFNVSLDDFGTGYSSLNYLTKLPIDKLKIDKSFVMELGRSARAESVVEIIIALSKSLGLQAVAEGVETENQLAFLEKLKCEYAQGYFFSHPLTGKDLLQFIDHKPKGNVVTLK